MMPAFPCKPQPNEPDEYIFSVPVPKKTLGRVKVITLSQTFWTCQRNKITQKTEGQMWILSKWPDYITRHLWLSQEDK